MAEESHSDLIARFTGVTDVDADRAKFYLESSAWQLDVALGSFYEDEEDVADVPSGPGPGQAPPSQPAAQPKPASRFATLSDMHVDEDSSEEEGQAFYAGGSERSGQQVLGPPRKKQSAEDFVQNMFKAAKEHGAETVEAASGPSQPKPASAFRGTGYRLGDTDEGGSEMVRGLPVQQGGPKQIDVVLKLWKKGFSVDDGPLRDYHDSANKEFLDSIHKGEVPNELLRMARGGEVSLNMEDHRTEDFVQPKKKLKAFAGEGHVLGSPAPPVTPAAAAGGSSVDAPKVDVDASKPTTNIQIRLADGTRMVAKFNHSHTVGDIRSYIIAAHPQYAGATFALMTTFPNKELTEESATLETAKLLNAVLVQRMK